MRFQAGKGLPVAWWPLPLRTTPVILDYPPGIGIWNTAGYIAGTVPQPMFGSYSAYLYASELWIGANSPSAALAQTGLVPADALSIHFATTPYSLLRNSRLKPEYWRFSVLLNGESLPYTMLDSGSNIVTWAADVSRFAGQTAELRFLLETYLPGTPLGDAGVAVGLDGISFSTQAIPEPSVLALVCIGAAMVGMLQLPRSRKGLRAERRLC